MGTSTRWPGPGGSAPGRPAWPDAVHAAWAAAARELAGWHPRARDAEARLERTANHYLDALHRTLRDDPAAFGLRDALRAAGERLTGVLDVLAVAGAAGLAVAPYDGDGARHDGGSPVPVRDFLAAFTTAVGGPGGKVVDAALRRAAMASCARLLDDHPDARRAVTERGTAGAHDAAGFDDALLCRLYRWFFADAVAEFLRAAMAERVRTVPVLPLPGPEGRAAERIAERALGLVPDPCADVRPDAPRTGLPMAARALVPAAVCGVLGLGAGAGPATDEEEAA